MHATKPLEIVHSDVCGPMRTTSLGGARYFVTYIDDFSRNVWVYLLKSKRTLEEVQGIQGTCGDTIEAQEQGVWVEQWRVVHFQGIQALLEGTRH
jgi:hypothetical protein